MSEGVAIRYAPFAELADELARLDRPWFATEGALDAWVEAAPHERPLLARGLAFDLNTTVTWDEEEVQVLARAPAAPDVVALASEVCVHQRFQAAGLRRLLRVDFLSGGTWLGSLYRPVGSETEGGDDA